MSRILPCSAALGLAALVAQDLGAQAVSRIGQLAVVGHHFTSELSSRTRRASVTDPAKSRYVVLKLEGHSATAGRVFTDDFVLRYKLKGVERRKQCSGLALAKEDRANDLGDFVLSNGSWIKIETGATEFALACILDHGIDAIQVYRLGVAEPISYDVGSDRPYSVFVTTNGDTGALDRVREALDAGGYTVTTSTSLAATTKKVTVHYASKAEKEGREVSQRLMTVLDRVPVFKKLTLRTKYDVIVWIGK